MVSEHFTLDDIAVVIANYKSKDLTQRAFETFRKFYPDVLVYIVDNGSGDDSTEYINNCTDDKLIKIINPANYGHGVALHQVADATDRRFLFTLDSDTITHKGGFMELMLEEMEADPMTYAVGVECETDRNGFNTYTGGPGAVRYIHPQSSLYDLQIYATLRPFIHHGAPCIENMIDANVRGLRLVNFPITDYVEHLGGGTCKVRGGWEPGVIKSFQNKHPFVSFVTRCHKRPRMLLRCLTSISRQDDPDFENVIIVDEAGIGVVAANALYNKPENKSRVHGNYVHLIDDDDVICSTDFVSVVKRIAAEHNPDVIIVRVKHPNGSVLPDAPVWMKKPIGGHIGGSSVVVRRDVWLQHIHAFGDGKIYGGDLDFVTELFNPRHNLRIYWCNRIMVEVPRQNRGQVEM